MSTSLGVFALWVGGVYEVCSPLYSKTQEETQAVQGQQAWVDVELLACGVWGSGV